MFFTMQLLTSLWVYFRSVSLTPRVPTIARGTSTSFASCSLSRWSSPVPLPSSSSFGWGQWTLGDTEISELEIFRFIHCQLPRAGLFLVSLKWLHYRPSIKVVVIDNTSIAILHAEAIETTTAPRIAKQWNIENFIEYKLLNTQIKLHEFLRKC